MKKIVLVLLMLTSCAFGDWLYNRSAKTLTECDSSGVALTESPWIFNVTASTAVDGVYNLWIKYKTIGAADKLDLQAPIHGEDAAIITALDNDFLKNSTSKALLTEIKLPLTLTYIGKEAFNGHTKLVHVEPFISDGVTYVGANAFSSTAITNDLRAGYGGVAMSFGGSVFSNSKSLSSADFGPGITATTGDMFKNCTGLKTLKLSDSLKTIATQTFEGCSGLTTVEPFLPNSVTAIGSSAFKSASAIKSEYLNLKANNQPLTINGSTFYIPSVTNIVFGDGSVYLASDAIMSASNVKTVRFGKGVLSLSSVGMKGFRLANYNARFDVPAGVYEWEEFINTYKNKDWADIPETGNNPSKAKYYEAFPDGPEPRCLLYIPGNESNNRYIWLYSYRYGEADDKVLYVHGEDTEGEARHYGAPEPGYGVYTDAGDSLPLVCTAPEFVDNGALTEYRCIGYRIDTMNDVGEWVKGTGVTDGTSSYTFNPDEAGSTRLTWLYEPYAYGLTVNLPALMDLGTVQIPATTHNEYYLKDSTITLVATATAEGARFVRWYGDVPEEQAYDAELALKMDGEKVIYPYFEHDWVVEGSYIIDGYWKFYWSGKLASMSIGKPLVSWAPGFIDFRKPIQGGGTIVTMAKDCFKNNTTITDVRIPDTVGVIGEYAFLGNTKLKNFSPFLPPCVTNISGSAFSGCSALTNALSIGGLKDATYAFSGSCFISCTKIPSITIGEGVTALSQDMFKSTLAIKELRFFCDKPTINDQTFQRSDNDTYKYKVKVYLPKGLPGWSEFVESSVTPWEEVSDTDKAKFYTAFGENATPPDGLLVETSKSMGQLRNQWYYGFSPVRGLTIFVK